MSRDVPCPPKLVGFSKLAAFLVHPPASEGQRMVIMFPGGCFPPFIVFPKLLLKHPHDE